MAGANHKKLWASLLKFHMSPLRFILVDEVSKFTSRNFQLTAYNLPNNISDTYTQHKI